MFHGGGTIFGPRPRDYSFKLNRKVKERLAVVRHFLIKKESGIIVVEDFTMAPKTKEFNAILKKIWGCR